MEWSIWRRVCVLLRFLISLPMVCLGFPFGRAVDTFLMQLFWWMSVVISKACLLFYCYSKMALLPFAIPCTCLQLHNISQVKTKGLLCPHLCLGQVYNSMENLIHLVILGPGMALLAVHHCALEHHAVPPSTQAIALSRPWPSRASVGTRQSMPLCLGIPMYRSTASMLSS